MEATIVESCHSTWVFDPSLRRFRRILKGIEVAHQPVVTEWRSYHELRMAPGDDTFTVILTSDGSRMIRSWRHRPGCTACGEHATTELSLSDVRAAASA